MKNLDKTEKKIYHDCEKAMRVSTLIDIVSEAFAGFLTVCTAKILGNFADAIFEANISLGLEYVADLVLCILLTVFLIPVISLMCNIWMLKDSLTHERMLQGRFLDKTYEGAMQIDEGEVQYRLEDDATGLRCEWLMLWEALLVTPFLFLFVMYQSIRLHLGFTFVVIGVSFIKLLVPMAVKKLEAKYDKETREYHTKVRSYETEFTTKPHIVKLFGLSVPMISRMDYIFQKFYSSVFVKKTRCTTVADQISGFLDTFCVLVILLIGAIFVSYDMMTAGAVAAMIGYFSVYNKIIENIGSVIRKFPIIDNCVQRLKLLYEDYENLEGVEIGEITEISAKQLSFSYNNKKVWENLSFKICKGEKVAICGSNGSGKSTFLKLLSGLNKQYEGSLRLNGTELQEVAMEKWREQFAYVTQEPYLFQGSVRENVALGNWKASKEEVSEVLQKTNLCHLAEREVSVEKNDLSGGEKQKISIARSLLRNVPIILMDEPGNNLDEKTVAWLKDFIQKSEKTILYVSHEETLTKLAELQIKL